MRLRLKILQANKVSSCSNSLPVSCVVNMKTSMVELEDANVQISPTKNSLVI